MVSLEIDSRLKYMVMLTLRSIPHVESSFDSPLSLIIFCYSILSRHQMSYHPLVKGAFGLLAAGAISIGLYLRHVHMEQVALRQETSKMVVSAFKTNRLQIIRNLLRLDTVKFDVKTLLAIHKAFSRAIEHKEHGVISYRAFERILVDLSVNSERLRETIFNLWDQNHDKNADFVELVEGLSTICFGDTESILLHYFQGFDADGSGDLSKSELRDLVSAMNPFALEMDNKPIDYLVRPNMDRNSAPFNVHFHSLLNPQCSFTTSPSPLSPLSPLSPHFPPIPSFSFSCSVQSLTSTC